LSFSITNEEFNKKNKNKLKRKYKNGVEQEYLDIHNKKLESIDDKGKLLLFKTLKTEYNASSSTTPHFSQSLKCLGIL
jgi:disulfide oxidoreductase YuzD